MINVKVSGGTVAGVVQDGVYAFKGIPYAAPLTGRNLWLPPQPPAPWSGVRDARTFGLICPQFSLTAQEHCGDWLRSRFARRYVRLLRDVGDVGSDCLNLNVWSRTLSPSARLPVMVWLHGGALINGSGANPLYDGVVLAHAGVVLVTFNYRLGSIGFLGGEGMFADGLACSNRGFMDQVAALQWVQQNIHRFGGDADNVTIFGESAGGSSVAALLVIPSAKGLFRRAICMSGAPDTMFDEREYAALALRVFAALKVPPGDSAALLRLSVKRLLRTQIGVSVILACGGRRRFGALGDSVHTFGLATGTAFAPTPLLCAAGSDLCADVDLLIGTCANDGRMMAALLPGPPALVMRLMMRLMQGMFSPRCDLPQAIAKYQTALRTHKNFALYDRMITDALFRRPSVQLADQHASRQRGRTWLYRFDWTASNKNPYAAMHAFDIPFVFGNFARYAPLFATHAAVESLHAAMRTAWVNFAREGRPHAPQLPRWAPYNQDTRRCMILSHECTLASDVDAPVRGLWDLS